MKRTILLSVMVFLLSIWKGNTQFTEKFEPDIPSDSATFELLSFPNVFSFKAKQVSATELGKTLSDAYLYDFTNQVCLKKYAPKPKRVFC